MMQGEVCVMVQDVPPPLPDLPGVVGEWEEEAASHSVDSGR